LHEINFPRVPALRLAIDSLFLRLTVPVLSSLCLSVPFRKLFPLSFLSPCGVSSSRKKELFLPGVYPIFPFISFLSFWFLTPDSPITDSPLIGITPVNPQPSCTKRVVFFLLGIPFEFPFRPTPYSFFPRLPGQTVLY